MIFLISRGEQPQQHKRRRKGGVELAMLFLKRRHGVEVVVDVAHSVGCKDGMIGRAEHRWIPHLHGVLVSGRQLPEEVIEFLQKCCRGDASSLKFEDEGAGVALKGLIEGCEDLVFKIACIKEVGIHS